MKNELHSIQGNISVIQEKHRVLQQTDKLQKVPKIQEIPNVDNFSPDLSSAEIALSFVNSKTKYIKDTIEDSLSFAKRSLKTINSTLEIVENGNRSIINTLQKFDLNSILNQMNITKENRFSLYKNIEIIEIIWTIIFSVIYSTPILFLFWGLICIIIGKFPFQYFMKL